MILKKLSDILKIAEESLKLNENGELILPIRKKIWKSFGESKLVDNVKVEVSVGLQRRVELALLCADKVLDIWTNNVKNDDRPERLLEKAKEYIDGKCDIRCIDEILGDFYTDLENMMTEETELINYVGSVILRISALVSYDEALIKGAHEEALEEDLDDDLDSYDWDASYYTALAYAGGAKWQEKSSSEKRREFWMWYIKEAVPQAYLAYQD
ncbi:Imm5 family immunity protein [Clostridium sp. ZBS13]|uniref:Imm5 family immunity protein n=1 Tax=Clostridium sp. ZBS13 TaxID=2949971 RepID=UPI00207A10AF|nr:Imm5 family immunity protein [Clostridium sp. ZBS13]